MWPRSCWVTATDQQPVSTHNNKLIIILIVSSFSCLISEHSLWTTGHTVPPIPSKPLPTAPSTVWDRPPTLGSLTCGDPRRSNHTTYALACWIQMVRLQTLRTGWQFNIFRQNSYESSRGLTWRHRQSQADRRRHRMSHRNSHSVWYCVFKSLLLLSGAKVHLSLIPFYQARVFKRWKKSALII